MEKRPAHELGIEPFVLLVILMLYEIFTCNNNFSLLTWCYSKLLIGENQDCNFCIVHVTLLRSTT